MNKPKTIDIGNHIYYFGSITKYERTEEEKENRLYMIKQKAIGIVLMVLMIVPVIIYKDPRILLFTGAFLLIGLAVTLTDQKVTG
jgi:hypothetical protein